ncbi:hypothetical protein E2562_010617 [Oryza meyeriana var. granulata]|uniref:Uncharacterized protein n=1 Tax=Oryza meyeriana var. granulata TaxID=110450 RepID=A0A6G1BW92_9ORYZ|nr:hypothetical protein E2562_010617 [Oryza meyeriana var. granulata]
MVVDQVVFVGTSNSVCVSTKAHPELRAGCVYFAADELAKGPFSRESYERHYEHDDKKKAVGVYSIKDGGRAEELPELGEHSTWPPPAWFTP